MKPELRKALYTFAVAAMPLLAAAGLVFDQEAWALAIDAGLGVVASLTARQNVSA